jgi:hypothetical protein
MLKVLTDEETAIRAFGKTPFVRTRNGVRYFLSDDPVFHTSVGESHRDQCLATFAAINLPLSTPIRLKAGVYSISNLLAESVANFSFDQSEPAWTAMAYAKYLPPKKEWTNRFGERTSFSRLAQYLLDLDWNSQSCGGTHIFGALVKIDKADGDHSILDEETRKRLKERVVLTLREAAASQQSDGGWNWRWCNGIKERNRPEGLPDRILVTGHLVELLNSLDARRRLPAGAYIRAGQWLSQSLDSAERDGSRDMICPLTHAARAAREALADR